MNGVLNAFVADGCLAAESVGSMNLALRRAKKALAPANVVIGNRVLERLAMIAQRLEREDRTNELLAIALESRLRIPPMHIG